MVGEFELIGVVVRSVELGAVKVVVYKRRVVVLIDIPVKTDHVFLVCPGTATRRLPTRVVVIRRRIGNSHDAVIVRLAEPGAFHANAGASKAHGLKEGFFGFLIGAENKESVFDDRAANGETILILGIRFGEQRLIKDLISAEVLAGPVIESTAGPCIRAGFGDGIDVAGRETTVGHVDWREFDRDLLKRIIRKRHAGSS